MLEKQSCCNVQTPPLLIINSQVGIDVAYKVTKYFLEVFGERISAGNPAIIQEMVDAGCLGKKSGKGNAFPFRIGRTS